MFYVHIFKYIFLFIQIKKLLKPYACDVNSDSQLTIKNALFLIIFFGNQSSLFSVESLKNKNINAEYKNFPNRTTEIGNVINSYLKSMVRTKFYDMYLSQIF